MTTTTISGQPGSPIEAVSHDGPIEHAGIRLDSMLCAAELTADRARELAAALVAAADQHDE